MEYLLIWSCQSGKGRWASRAGFVQWVEQSNAKNPMTDYDTCIKLLNLRVMNKGAHTSTKGKTDNIANGHSVAICMGEIDIYSTS